MKRRDKAKSSSDNSHIIALSKNKFSKINFIIFALVFAGIASFFFRSSQAATQLYVSTTGSGTSSCAQTAPCTFAHADSLATPGTTVHVAPGTYSGAINLSKAGTASDRIIWLSDSHWGAHVANVIVGGDYTDFEGFDAVGGTDNVVILVTGNYARVIGNHVHNLPIACTGNNGGAGIDFDGGEKNYTTHNQEAIGNLVEDIGSGPRDGSCSLVHGIYMAVPYGRAVNNIVRRATGDGITSWHAATNLIIVNNTLVDNGGNGILVGNGDTGGSTAGNHDSYVANNIAAHNAEWAITECCDATHHGPNTYVDNLGWANTYNVVGNIANGGTQTGSINVDPKFADYTGGDYHLQSTSPAINSGTNMNAPNNDFDSITRPQGSAYDIGAYEFQNSSSSGNKEGWPDAYGNAWGADNLANLELGSSKSRTVDYKFMAQASGQVTGVHIYLITGSGYSAGNGGVIRARLETDSGGLPSGTALASGTISDPLNGSFRTFSFASTASVTAGQVYHLVFDNTASDSAANFVSIDDLALNTAMAQRQPFFSDSELRVSYNDGSGWNVAPLHTPIFTLLYGDGSTHGPGAPYVNARSVSLNVHVGSSTQAGELFTPSGSVTVTGAHVRLGKVGSPGVLNIRLKTASGTSMASCATSPGITVDWYGCSFSSSVTLSAGTSYRLTLDATGSSSSYYNNYPLTEGSGFDSPWMFSDGYFQDSSNSGSTWTSSTSDDMMFWLDLTPSSPPVTKPGDINNDGRVDILDLSILLSKYGGTDSAADINKDGVINVFDLSVLLSHYGT
jgi:hypothetical protein